MGSNPFYFVLAQGIPEVAIISRHPAPKRLQLHEQGFEARDLPLGLRFFNGSRFFL